MNKEKVQLFTSIDDYEKVNNRFAKVKIRIAYAGENRNGSFISKEAFERASHTLKYTPIVGYMCEDGEFDGHTEKIEIVDGEWNIETLTRPYGVVSDEKPFWEAVKCLDGSYKDYYTCYGYLWVGRYPELETIKNGDYAQSMEILPCGNSGFGEDGLYHIEDFTFDGLCILQKKEPCFEDSTISINFSKAEFEEDYKSMITELKSFTLQSFEEGGEEVSEEEKKIEMEEETTEPKVEELVVEDVKTEEEPSSEEFENKDGEKEPISSNFELSFDEIRDKLNEMVRYQVKDVDVYRYVCTVYNDYFVYEEETYDERYTQKYYKQGYSKTESEVTLEGERVEVFTQFLTREEINKLEADKAEFEKKHADEINELKSNFVDLQGELELAKDNYSKLEEEVVGLREFKANIEFEEHKAMVDERLDKYSELETIDGYSELVKDKYTCDIDALEKEIKVFAFDNGVILGKKQKKNFSKEVSGRIPVAQKNVETRKESAWDILDKYVPNK